MRPVCEATLEATLYAKMYAETLFTRSVPDLRGRHDNPQPVLVRGEE